MQEGKNKLTKKRGGGVEKGKTRKEGGQTARTEDGKTSKRFEERKKTKIKKVRV